VESCNRTGLRNQAIRVHFLFRVCGKALLAQVLLNAPVGGVRPNPNFQSINYTTNGGGSSYHSLQAQYKLRLVRGVQALANYTWSHAIDDASSDIAYGTQLDRGNAAFDVRHNFSSGFTWTLPSANAGRLIDALVNNWSLSGIVRAQSGFPVNLTGSTILREGIQITSRPNYVLGIPLYLEGDANAPGGMRFNPAKAST
jgi:hypothetical protein